MQSRFCCLHNKSSLFLNLHHHYSKEGKWHLIRGIRVFQLLVTAIEMFFSVLFVHNCIFFEGMATGCSSYHIMLKMFSMYHTNIKPRSRKSLCATKRNKLSSPLARANAISCVGLGIVSTVLGKRNHGQQFEKKNAYKRKFRAV